MVDDPNSWCAEIFHHQSQYVRREVNGVAILEGPVGGYCTMTTRELYDQVGGFGQGQGHVFWGEEQPFIEKLEQLGHRSVVLADLEVHHASGPYYSDVVEEKIAYYTWKDRRARRRNRVKRALVKVPGIARLNERHGWFHVLEGEYQPPPEAVGEKRLFVAGRRRK